MPIGDFLQGIFGGSAQTYRPVQVGQLGAAPVARGPSSIFGQRAIQQQAAISGQQAQRQALSMAAGRGDPLSRTTAIQAGGQAQAQIGAQAAQAGAGLQQQVGQMQSAVDVQNAQIAQRQQLEQFQAQNQAQLQAQNLTAGSAAQTQAGANQMGGALMGGIGPGVTGLAALSDERMKIDKARASKIDVAQALKEAREMFEGVEPMQYRYSAGSGQPQDRRVGVMAQDVEAAGGGGMVSGDPKRIDMGKAFSAMLASHADLHERLDRIEHGKR